MCFPISGLVRSPFAAMTRPARAGVLDWVTALAAAGLSLLLLVVFDLVASTIARRRDPGESRHRFQTVFLLATLVFYSGAIGLPYAFKFDRYVIPILALLPALVVLVPGIQRIRPSRSALVASLLVTACFGGYSVATVHDYFAWNRALGSLP